MNKGKDTIYLVQRAKETLGTAAYLIANQTEGSYSIETEIIDEQTKFGRLVDYGNTSESFDLSMYGQTGDAGQKAILDAIKNKEQLKVWEVNTNKNANGKYDANFAYTIVESVERSGSTDGFEELSTTLQVIGQTQPGELDTTEVPDEVVEFALYGFEKPGEFTGEYGKDHADAVTDPETTTP